MKIIFPSLILAVIFGCLANKISAQKAGYKEQEGNPVITLKECTISGGCTSSKKKVTLDANWRHIHKVGVWDNCYTGNKWDSSVCSDPKTCAQNCAVEQVTAQKYGDTYGVKQLANGVKLEFVTEHQHGTNVGSRLYVLDDNDKYFMFQLKNREFSVDIDVSELQCGMNGALYFVEMDEDGGKGLGNNEAGAKYGTGYCDAQCPHDIKFISGEANVIDWKPNPKDKSNNMGIGKYGSCCAEMDIWEANSMATAYTPHPCDLGGDFDKPAQFRCEGMDCGDNDKNERYKGVCDKDGCDINPFRMGNQMFYGRGEQYTVNTLKPMTVVTQFLTTDGTDDGELSEIHRFYVQDGKTIKSPFSTILGTNDSDHIDDAFCKAKKDLFGDIQDFEMKGGNANMGHSLDRGQVLALSLWDDVEVNMLWLDSAYPLDKGITEPGVKRGECPGGDESTPTYVRNNFPDGYVTFQNIAIGEIGSTQNKSPTTAPTRGPCSLCGPAPGKNQPECVGHSKDKCLQMVQYEGKCRWDECPPTPMPVATPTTSPIVEKNPCCSCNYKDCRAGWCSESKENCDKCGDIWMPLGAQVGCVDQWNLCNENLKCCDGLICENNQCKVEGECTDDESYTYEVKNELRNCAWLTKNTNSVNKFCKKKDNSTGPYKGKQIQDICKKGCGSC